MMNRMLNRSSKHRGARNVQRSRPAAPLGQHFLGHPQIAERIVRVAHLEHGDLVLEVGPGRGILTAALLATGAKVIAVEADAALLAGLHERFASEIADKRL